MAGGSGHDLLQALGSDPGTAGIPVIVLTSSSYDSEDRARAMALGAKRYLHRPLDPEYLVRHVRACLGGSAAGPAARATD